MIDLVSDIALLKLKIENSNYVRWGIQAIYADADFHPGYSYCRFISPLLGSLLVDERGNICWREFSFGLKLLPLFIPWLLRSYCPFDPHSCLSEKAELSFRGPTSSISFDCSLEKK